MNHNSHNIYVCTNALDTGILNLEKKSKYRFIENLRFQVNLIRPITLIPRMFNTKKFRGKPFKSLKTDVQNLRVNQSFIRQGRNQRDEMIRSSMVVNRWRRGGRGIRISSMFSTLLSPRSRPVHAKLLAQSGF